MGLRQDLQALLETTLGSDNVYFQPPTTLTMKYPAIVYALSAMDIKRADNRAYTFKRRYTLTFISQSPVSPVVDALAMLPLCSFDRHYKADNLNHYSYNIYY